MSPKVPKRPKKMKKRAAKGGTDWDALVGGDDDLRELAEFYINSKK